MKKINRITIQEIFGRKTKANTKLVNGRLEFLIR